MRASSAVFPYMAPSLREWLETDGLGGFASSTAAAINTRRYHGWLFLCRDDGERFLALSKIHDAARSAGNDFDLSTSYYPGGKHPGGVKNLWLFRRDPFPAFIYNLGGKFLSREIFMEKGSPGVFCRYLPESRPWGEDVELTARPMCNFRSYHYTALSHTWEPAFTPFASGVVIEGHPACKELLLAFHGASFHLDPKWYYNMIYPEETARGLGNADDHLSPGTFTTTVSPSAPGYFWAGPLPAGAAPEDVARDLPARYEDARRREVRRRARLFESGGLRGNEFHRLAGRLSQAADQFVVDRNGSSAIIAGYHWFGEWGRDTFISVPGLLLCTGRYKEAREIFLRFCEHMKGGLIPNVLSQPASLYNSADASLWMVNALTKYEQYSGDTSLPLALLPKLQEVVQAYLSGTAFSIGVTEGGLLCAGSPDTQVTWMDACAGGCPVTPRHGAPVELNALFISALEAIGRWTDRSGESGAWYRQMARRSRAAFRRSFLWRGSGLYDRIQDGVPVMEVRPNQVIAASLGGVQLPLSVAREVWDVAVNYLLTPRGLRTLSPAHPAYRGTYKGNPAERDSAYHQGTAWPYLIGSLFDLSARLDGARGYGPGRGPYGGLILSRALPGIVRLDENPCIGSIFEVASGSFPYEMGGAVSQAWSVGEILRVMMTTQRTKELAR